VEGTRSGGSRCIAGCCSISRERAGKTMVDKLADELIDAAKFRAVEQ